jgi:hypothetical protein
LKDLAEFSKNKKTFQKSGKIFKDLAELSKIWHNFQIFSRILKE